MTEDEAKMMQCCGPEGCGYFNDQPRPARWCVGSSCMAWRVDGERRVPGTVGEIASYIKEHNVGALSALGATSRTERTGFCGLAGSPQ